MAFIGNQPLSQAFVTDQFSGNGSTTAFTMSVSPANTASVLVAVSGVLQDPSTYSVSGTTLTFSAAPPTGTGNISARYLGIPASGITTTAYRTVTEFTATASQTTFTPASYTPGFINVYRNGSLLGSADYTATNGTTVVLAVGATVGDLVSTESFYVSSVLNAIPSVGGSVTNIYLDAASGTGTGAMRLPVGTTAQRPTGSQGLVRLNSTTGNPEWWDATTSSWLQFSQPAGYSVNYLVVAGGGGGGGRYGGGGGAGGLLTSSISLSSGTAYTITVGAGGAGGTDVANSPGTDGANSSISGLAVATGGGGGGGTDGYNGRAGGSGGGGGRWGASSGGTATAGQGNAGGGGTAPSASPDRSGGGGGASAVGANGITSGNGGAGAANSISGSSVTYAGGGGGGANGAAAGTGGAGGGGNGSSTGAGTAGTANTGGGGGGGFTGAGIVGGTGGSGIVIISYLGSQRGTGGTVTSSGGYTIHTFTSSGTYNA